MSTPVDKVDPTVSNGASASREFPERRVYAVFGVPPEIQAYAMARYSRSSRGMLESIAELSQQRAEEFLNTFYFQYGHRSIADLAHVVFGVEQISLLAAIALVDEQVWDGQERSTRYQPFRSTGWYRPPEIAGTEAEAVYEQTASGLFSTYELLTSRLVDVLQESVARPAEMADAPFKRTLRARAFDVSRALLPLATHTSVGQVVSARVLERQIARLLASPLAEMRALGDDLKDACRRPAEMPLGPASPEMEAPRPAPTLVKYAVASPYAAQTRAEMEPVASEALREAGPPDRSRSVELTLGGGDPREEMAATLLYRHDVGGHSYQQCLAAAQSMGTARQEEILALSLQHRGPHDDLLREHQSGYGLIFDVLVDWGSFRDLHRHRRCVQVQQPLTWTHAWDPIEDVLAAALGPGPAEMAQDAGLGDVYADVLGKTAYAAQMVRAVNAPAGDYLLPLAYRTRCLFKMDWAEAVYVIELRTGSGGHFSYRRIAWQMYQELQRLAPSLSTAIRVEDPTGPPNLLDR